MFKSKLTFRNILVLLGLVGSLIWLAVFSFPDNRLHLIFCDVGQGDATLITKGFNQILIDGGPNNKVLACLKNNLPFWDKKIEIVALTHPEADHMTGLISVLDKYEVEYFLSGAEGNSSAIFAELSSKFPPKGRAGAVQSSKLKIVNPYLGDRIRLGEITLNTWWPSREFVAERIEDDFIRRRLAGTQGDALQSVLGVSTTHSKLNDFSLVFLLRYNDKKVLLMGDADSRVQDDILQVNSLKQIDVLKFPHHGSKTGMSKDFLEKIKPKEAVISVGKNSYGHPTEEALDMLESLKVSIRRTDVEGEIKYKF